MLAAILKGKISRRIEGSEDLLTSVVFGVIQRLPYELGWEPMLRALAPAKSLPFDPSSVRVHDVEYWPWWSEEQAPQGAEPDVALWLSDGKRKWLLVIEAKRASGKSGHGERDQLGRQAANALALAERSNAYVAGLVYLTAHFSRPVSDLRASQHAMRHHFGIDAVPLLWMSWRAFAPILERASQSATPYGQQAKDCLKCLEKWGLFWFQGVDAVHALPTYTFDRNSP